MIRPFMPLTFIGLVVIVGFTMLDRLSGSSATELEVSRTALSRSLTALSEAKQAESYACGYIAGQRAIWKAAKLGDPIQPAWMDFCTPLKTIAFAHGFTNE